MVNAAHCLGFECDGLRFSVEIHSGAFKMPTRRTLQRWQVQFNLIQMGWLRNILSSKRRTSRHGGADASPIAGFHYLCSREDIMHWDIGPKVEFANRPLLGGFKFTSRRLPISTSGLSKSNVADKDYNILRSIHLLVGEKLHIHLCQY